MSGRTPTWRIFAIPLLLGVATLMGLVAGLIGEGSWDITANLLLAVPLVLATWHWRRQCVERVKGTCSTFRPR